MKSTEAGILSNSEYYIYTPIANRPSFLFYCCSAGHFFYEPGYHLKRDFYDSNLIFYVKSGSMCFGISDCTEKTVYAGEVLLMDCHAPHQYFTMEGCECYWVHFDGGLSREYLSLIVSALSSLPVIVADAAVTSSIVGLFTLLSHSSINEPEASDLINRLLTRFLVSAPKAAAPIRSKVVSEAMAYINSNFAEPISSEYLASSSGFSLWHFIRLFQKETGYTPHDYLIQVRINAARYMLSSTSMTIKEICFACGYSGESVFSTAFKRETGKSPLEYRKST